MANFADKKLQFQFLIKDVKNLITINTNTVKKLQNQPSLLVLPKSFDYKICDKVIIFQFVLQLHKRTANSLSEE